METTRTLKTAPNPEIVPGSINAVVFDFGGVFTESPVAVVRAAAEDAGICPEGLIDLMLGGYGIESDHPWQRVERGEMALDDACAWARAQSLHQLGVEIDPLEVMQRLMTTPLRAEMIHLAKDIRRLGVPIAMLTNNARELAPVWKSQADWSSMFDVIVDSSEIGCRKPAPQAFQAALHALGMSDPSTTLMIDDFSVNVEGARKVGMQAIQVDEDPTEAVEAVRTAVFGNRGSGRWSQLILAGIASMSPMW